MGPMDDPPRVSQKRKKNFQKARIFFTSRYFRNVFTREIAQSSSAADRRDSLIYGSAAFKQAAVIGGYSNVAPVYDSFSRAACGPGTVYLDQ